MSKSEMRRIAYQKTGKFPDPPDWELTKTNLSRAVEQAIEAFAAFVVALEKSGELENAEGIDDASDEKQEGIIKDE